MAERPLTGADAPASIDDIAGFGRALTQLRQNAALTVRQVAEKAGGGASYTTLGGWFAGRGLPSLALRRVFIDTLRACGVQDDQEVAEWLDAVERVRRAPGRRPGAMIPYRGLAPFEPEDSPWFFGRGELTGQLLAAVTRLSAADGGIMLVTGASGAGKSSVLRAGLIPALPTAHWPTGAPTDVVLMTPGSTPSASLADRLTEVIGPRPLLIVDQFEEIFTSCPDAADRSRFVDALSGLADGPRRALIVIGLRADFYAAVLQFPRLRGAAQDTQVPVGAMETSELREAIAAPARRAHLDVEDGFVDAVLHDLIPRGGQATLPLLSYAMFSTWRAGHGRRLTIADYRAAGGISGAVAASAEAAYAALPARQKTLAKRLFLSLVHVDPGGADSRRRLPRSDLLAGDSGVMAEVVDRFVAERLITADAETVEISHEALLSAWPQLTAWLDEDRESLLVGRQLARIAAQWQQDDRLDDDLLRGARLGAAVRWTHEHPDDRTSAIAEFLKASQRQERRRARRVRRTIAALTALVLIAAAGAITATAQWRSAIQLRVSAVSARDQALSRLVATRADQLRGRDPSLAAQLAAAAYVISPTYEARSSLLTVSGSTMAARLLDPAGNGIVPAAAISPDGRIVAVARDNMIRIWDNLTGTHTPSVAATLRPVGAPSWDSVMFSPAGDLLIAGGDDGTLDGWTVADPRHPVPLSPLPKLSGAVFGLAFAEDGRRLAATDGSTFRLWSIVGDQLTPAGSPVPVTSGVIKSVALSRDGRTLASGDAAGVVTAWNIADPDRPHEFAKMQGSASEIGQIALSPDGRTVASGARDGIVFIWSLAAPSPARLVTRLTGAQSFINALAFSPDGTKLAAGSSDTTVGVRIWDIGDQTLIATLPHAAPVTSVAFSTDGTRLVTASNDGIVRIWPVRGVELVTPGVISSTVFSADGRILAVGSTTAGMRLWNTADPDRPTPFGPPVAGADSFAGSFSFSPDGRTLAVSYGGGRGFQLWNVTDPAAPTPASRVLDVGKPLIESVAFAPDGRRLATAGNDGTVEIWSVSSPPSPQRLAVLTGFGSYATWVTFSPDGRTVAASSNDKTVRLWDVSDPSVPQSLGPPIVAGNHFVYCVAFSPDGQTLALASGDSTIRLWNVRNRAHPMPIGSPLAGPTDYVYLLTFARDGHTIAAAVNDGTVWLWDVRNLYQPAPIATLTTSAAALYTVGYRGHDPLIVAGGAGGMARLLDTDPATAINRICANSGNPLTPSEWTKYVPDEPYNPPCSR